MSSHVEAVAGLVVEAVGEVAAFAVVSDVVVAAPQFLDERGEAGIADGIVVVRILRLNGDGELVVGQQAQAGKGLGDAVALVGAVVSVEFLKADHRQASLAILALSLGGDEGREDHGEVQIVLRGDGGAVAEDQTVVQGDGVGEGAILILNLVKLLDDRLVDLEAAFLGGGDSFQAVDEVVNVKVSSTGVGAAERGIAELAGQVGGVADDDVVVGLLTRPVDQSLCRAPVRVRRMLVNALDLCVVNIVVLVAVEGDLREEIVPTGHVVLPPGGVDVVFGLVLGVLGNSGLVDHCHGQEVHAELIGLALVLDVSQTGGRILLHVVDRDLVADLVVQLGVILAPLLAVQELCSGRLVLVSRLLLRLSGSLFAALRGGIGFFVCLLAAGEHGDDHDQSKNQSQKLEKILFHCVTSYKNLYIML